MSMKPTAIATAIGLSGVMSVVPATGWARTESAWWFDGDAAYQHASEPEQDPAFFPHDARHRVGRTFVDDWFVGGWQSRRALAQLRVSHAA